MLQLARLRSQAKLLEHTIRFALDADVFCTQDIWIYSLLDVYSKILNYAGEVI